MYPSAELAPVHLQGELFPNAPKLLNAAMLRELKEQLRRERADELAREATAKARQTCAKRKSCKQVITLSLRKELRHSVLHTLALVRRVMNIAEIADACECSEHRAETLLRELVKDGAVRLALAPNGYEAVRKTPSQLH